MTFIQWKLTSIHTLDKVMTVRDRSNVDSNRMKLARLFQTELLPCMIHTNTLYTLTPTPNATKYKFLENRSRYWFVLWYCLSHSCSLHMYVKIIQPWRPMATLHGHIRVSQYARFVHYLQFFILHLPLYSFVCYFFESADFNKILHGYLNMVLSKVLQFSNQ